jgi:dienelactone hydrolase
LTLSESASQLRTISEPRMDSAQTSANNSQTSLLPSKSPKRSLWMRFRLSLRVWCFKVVVRVAIAFMRTFRLAQFFLRPSYIKRYPVGAKMWNDVWLPPGTSSKPGAETAPLPLYIDIHGGGFAIGDPRHDAEFCHYLSAEHGIVVVSVNYPKAPLYPYPEAIEELVRIVKSVLDDDSLPVDKTKVALGGFSAGANLSLSIALRDELQGRLRGLLLYYPVTDFSGQYKGYADRKRLPPKLFFIGAEYDYLCCEAEKTAELYAAHEMTQDRVGDENDWTVGNIRWKKYLDVQHGFNFVRKWEAESERHRQDVTKAAYADSAEWLKKQIYA